MHVLTVYSFIILSYTVYNRHSNKVTKLPSLDQGKDSPMVHTYLLLSFSRIFCYCLQNTVDLRSHVTHCHLMVTNVTASFLLTVTRRILLEILQYDLPTTPPN